MDLQEIVSPGVSLRFLSAAEIREQLDISVVIDAVRQEFLRQGTDGLEHPPRLSLGQGGLLVMAARNREKPHSIVKVLHIDQTASRPAGAPSIMGVMLWLGHNDQPIIAADAGTITLMRTAAMVVIATELLAEPKASILAVLGSGRQAAEQIFAIAQTRPLTKVSIWSRTRANADDLARRVNRQLPHIQVRVAADPDEAVRGAEIICCATAATKPLFDVGSIAPHAHVNAIGSYLPTMMELPTELLRKASTIAVDDAHACLTESGEVIDAVRTNTIRADKLRELGDLLVNHPRRHGVTVFKSVGVALADYAVGELLQHMVSPRSSAAVKAGLEVEKECYDSAKC